MLQRSLSGLFRSLLHETLKSCPELIAEVLPDCWDQVQSMPWQAQTDLRPQTDEIRAAFSQLIKHRNLYEKHCFCFFIDGLDEYEETRQEDYKAMVKLLCSWTTAAPEDVKICVSSREYNVFLNAFSPERRLRLQDLTRGDIERYARDHLGDMGNEIDQERLVQAITDRSSGIFLWVALVVKSLRQQAEDGYELSALEKELDSLPDELDDLFEHLLKSVGKSARKKAYQTFAMNLKLRPYELDLTLFSYSFLEDYGNDPEFAMRASFPGSSMDNAARNGRLDLARKRLNGCCRGLLEPTPNRERGGDSVITFTHRSVPEFLEKPKIQGDMDSHLKGFSPEDAISQLLLAEVRSTKDNRVGDSRLGFFIYAILDLRHRSKTDHAPYSFRDCLYSAVRQYDWIDPEHGINGFGAIQTAASTFCPVDSRSRFDTANMSPFYISAFLGDHEYVSWKIDHDPTTIDTDIKTALLLGWIQKGAIVGGNPGCLKLLELFLTRGLSPQAIIHTSRTVIHLELDGEISFWQHFILRAALRCTPEHGAKFHRVLGEIIEKFLRCGADPYFRIFVPKEEHARAGKPKGSNRYERVGGCEIQLRRGRRKIEDRVTISTTIFRYMIEKGGDVSLRDLIEFWELDNKETLLQLIDRNIGQQEQAAREDTGIRDQQPLAEEKDMAQDEGVPKPGATLQLASESISEKAEEGVVSQAQDAKFFESWLDSMKQSHVVIFLLGECSLLTKCSIIFFDRQYRHPIRCYSASTVGCNCRYCCPQQVKSDWGGCRMVVLGKGEILRAVVATANCRPMGARLESGCGLASSVDQEHGCAAYVRMGACLDSLYGPANSADQDQEYAVVVTGTEKRFPKRSPLGRVLHDHLSKGPPHPEGDRARSVHL